MVRNYVRRTDRGDWGEDAMKLALEDLGEKRASLNKIAATYGIPKSTILRRFKLGTKGGRRGPPCCLGNENEAKLVELIRKIAEEGIPATSRKVRQIAYSFAAENNLPHRFNRRKKEAGYDWMIGFLKRHQEVLGYTPLQAANNPDQDLQDPSTTQGKQCMIKWKGLRDRYVKIRKQNEQKKIKINLAAQKKGSWKFYDVMNDIFAGNQGGFGSMLATQEMCTDEAILPNSYEEAIGIKTEIIEEPETTMMPEWNDPSPPAMPEEALTIVHEQSNRTSDDVTHQTDGPSVNSDARDRIEFIKNSLQEDEVFHFAMNIALRLKKLKRWPMLKAMNGIENALFAIEAEETN